MNPTTPSTSDDDPGREAAILIARLTIVAGDLKQQVAANTQNTATLEKLIREEVQQKLTHQLSALGVSLAGQQADISGLKTEVTAIPTLIDRRFVGLHGRFILIITLLASVGAVLAIGVIKILS